MKAGNVLLVFIGIIAAFLFGEVALRISRAPVPKFSEGIYDFPCYRSSSVSWLALKNNAACTLRSKTGAFPDTRVVTNANGLRNAPITEPKPAGTIRILFLGDSFTFGFGVRDTEAFPSLAGAALAKKFPSLGVDAINAGLPVAGSGRYYVRLTNSSYAKDADIIVVALYMYNDLEDVQIQPQWIDENGDGLPDKTVSAKAHIDYMGNLVSNGRPWFLEYPVLHDSRLLSLLNYWWWRTPFYRTRGVTTLIPDTLCVYMPDCHKYDKDIEAKKRLFLGIRKFTAEHKQKLLFVMIPAEFQVYDAARYKYSIPIALSPEEKRLPDDRLAVFFREHGIAYLDLLPVLSSGNGPYPYFEKDEHFNAAGHRAASDAMTPILADFISQISTASAK